MVILGINAYHANSSAAIVADGQLLAAVEEERLNRVKYAAGLPARAIQYCLDQAGVKLSEVDHIAIPRNPWARLGTKLRFAMRMPRFALDRARVMKRFAGIQQELATAFEMSPDRIRAKFHRIEHHAAHLASAFYVSPFERAAILSADGLGDFASSMWAQGEGPKMRQLGEVTFPHSLGMYYTALTQYIGFWKFGDEFKVMGLAAYGQPEFLDEFRQIVYADGPLSFRLGLEYFNHQTRGADMTWRDAGQTPILGRLFSTYLEERLGPARKADEPLQQRPAISPRVCRRHSRKCLLRTGASFRGRPERNPCASPAAWHSTASPMEKYSNIRHLSACTSSPPPATPDCPWAQRLP
jgi:carbamoyltransferase